MIWLLLGCLAVLLVGVYLRAVKGLIEPPEELDELHFADTRDGWRLALRRYRPRGVARSDTPVILCHGLGANAGDMDLSGEVSLARYLARKGFDSWVLELRGRGRSSRPARWSRRFGWGWTFDHFVELDLPAAIDHVLEATGVDQVHWVGHSMGGMVMYVYLQGEGAAKVRSLSAIGSPAIIPKGQANRLLARLGLALPRGLLPCLPLDLLGRLIAPFMGFIRLFLRGFANGPNLTAQTARQALASGVAGVSGGVLLQFADWVVSGEIRSADRQILYSEGYDRIRTPCLFVGGSKDRLAPVDSLRPAYEAASSPMNRFVVVGKEEGCSADYGHGDLTIGRHAARDVFPLVEEWLWEVEGNTSP